MKKTLVIIATAAALSLPWAASAKGLDPAVKDAQVVKGGPSDETAMPIEFNREYRLDRHLKQGEFEHFFLRVPPDTIVTLEARTFEKGLSWTGGRRTITTEPFAGVQLVDPKKNVVQSVQIAGFPYAIRYAAFRNRNAGEEIYNVRVGSSSGAIHKDQMLFKVSVSPFVYGDLGTDRDAGSTELTAFPIQAGRNYTANSIGGGDSRDVFLFSADKKQYYSLAVRGEDPIPVPLRVTVWTEGKKKNEREKLVSYISGEQQQVATESFKIPKDGQYFVEVSAMGPVKEKSLYSLELVPVGGPAEKSVSSEGGFYEDYK